MRRIVGMSVVALLAACGASPEDVREIRNGQREIRAKLDELAKKVDQIASRPAAPARPQGADPDKVYNIPAGNSPFKGPAGAPVILAEFSDFQ